jgi:competence ComEA-like helix-hairpin-helix protein
MRLRIVNRFENVAIVRLIETVMAGKTGGTNLNLNTATPKELTQLPGIAKNVAYRIVNHRKGHGLFTHREELLEVRDLPPPALHRIKQRATLAAPPDMGDDLLGPRRNQAEPLTGSPEEAERLQQSNPLDPQQGPAQATRLKTYCPCGRRGGGS